MKRSMSGIVIAAALVLGACGGDDRDDADVDADAETDDEVASIESSDGPGDDVVDDGPVDAAVPSDSGEPTGATDTPVCGDFDPEAPDVGAVDCADPHDAELAGVVPVPDGLRSGVIPDPVAVDACRETAETVSGGPVWSTGLTVLPFESTSAGRSAPQEVECWIVSPVDGALTGSLRRVPPAAALGELVSVFTMEPGECYVIEQDAFGFLTLVRPGGCDEVGAQRLIGLVPVDGESFPGNDAIEALGRDACAEHPDAPADVEFLYLTPFEAEWVLGQRVVVCSGFAGDHQGDDDDPLAHDHDDDGHGDDGQGDDGHGDDGHGDDGHGDDGHGDDEHGDDDHGDDGHGDDEHGDDGHGEEDHGDDGHGDDEHGEEGHGDDGHGDDPLADDHDHGRANTVEGYRYPAGSCYRHRADARDPVGTVVDCDEPHRWEYVGEVGAVVRTIPDDLADARALFVRTCERSVSEATGMSIALPGVSLAYRVEGELGGPIVGTVACFAGVAGGDHLIAPLDGDVVSALGDVAMVWRLEPGTCFTFVSDTFDLGLVAPCDEAEARVHIGSFELPNGPYPGEDELREIRDERCADLLSASGDVGADADSVSGTIPSEPDWRNARRRTVTCDALPG